MDMLVWFGHVLQQKTQRSWNGVGETEIMNSRIDVYVGLCAFRLLKTAFSI